MKSEEELSRQLTVGQLSMIAIGGAIGTGLFLGSSLSVHIAGPGVIISYLIGAVITLLFMGALCEMAVAMPMAGSFGIYADRYISPWAGFTVRYTYWACQCIAIGNEAVAISIYCQFWFPDTPRWLWVLAFSIALIAVNARSVNSFGWFEYWFSMIKVIAIALFIVAGGALLFGFAGRPGVGFANYTAHGGFLPHGVSGVWQAMVIVILSYTGTEVAAVTAGEARDPDIAVPRALRQTVGRLLIFYIGAITILIGLIPWNLVQPGTSVTTSPFVRVFAVLGVPAAASIINFVVITAAASSMNCNFYLVSRMMYSLARGGYAPAAFGRLSKRGVPVQALLASAIGLAIAFGVALLWEKQAFVYLYGVSLFGILFVWLMIFITHLRFRPMWERSGGRALPARMIGYPYTSLLGAATIVAILLTTWWVEGMRIALIAGIPWLALLTIAYYIVKPQRLLRSPLAPSPRPDPLPGSPSSPDSAGQ
ncbi:MAG TPA: amino acid permease [Gemmatimonadaceae bacterium]|nr:amino acid permease [Gemmatimonadaceae bacterium]